MSKVLRLSKWQHKPLAKREEYSEDEDEENDEDDSEVVEPLALVIPLKKVKPKPVVPKKKPRIPKKAHGVCQLPLSMKRSDPPGPPGPPPGAPPQKRRKQNPKPSNIPSRA